MATAAEVARSSLDKSGSRQLFESRQGVARGCV